MESSNGGRELRQKENVLPFLTEQQSRFKLRYSNLRDLIRYLRKRKREEIIEFKYRFVGRVVRVLLPYRDRPIYRRYIYDG